MIMTPALAKTKTCPHIRYCVNESQVRDGTPPFYDYLKCIASDCMAWRWIEPYQGHLIPDRVVAGDGRGNAYLGETEPPRPESLPDDAVWVPFIRDDGTRRGGYWDTSAERERQALLAMASRRGYCGLSGEPKPENASGVVIREAPLRVPDYRDIGGKFVAA